jgi:hypothetical protein
MAEKGQNLPSRRILDTPAMRSEAVILNGLDAHSTRNVCNVAHTGRKRDGLWICGAQRSRVSRSLILTKLQPACF